MEQPGGGEGEGRQVPGQGVGLRGVGRPARPKRDAPDTDRKLEAHHEQTLWVYWTIVLLGFWMLLSPVTFEGGATIATPSGGRTLWLSDAARVSCSRWSDLASGLLLVVLGGRALRPNRPVSLWAACFVGIWLTFAPLVFWAPSAAIYLNDTLVGALVIALTVLVPGMPNMLAFMKMGGAVPAGWSYNPSSWPQRWIMIALAFAGWLVSRYLAAYQLGYTSDVWEPFFGSGTTQVLDSDLSHALPISDAGLGALAYTFEFLMGWMGSPKRWRTMPWMVLFFGILVIPLGLVHILLVISQPVVVGHWCTLCLLAAALMLPMLPLAADEVVAMGQHVLLARRRGESTWSVFWKGGEPGGASEDGRSPALMALASRPGPVLKATIWGMSAPWTLTSCALLGAGLMATPALLGVARPASILLHLGGALVLVWAALAMGEVLRMLRLLNVPLGLAIGLGPWFVDGAELGARLVVAVAGLAIALLSLSRGRIRERYGIWERWVI